MRMIGCDRCGAVFPYSVKRTELLMQEFTDQSNAVGDEVSKDLCPVCRHDLNAFFDGTNGVPERVGPQTMPGREPEIQPTPQPIPEAQDLDEPSAPRAQDAVQHTCEICGRVGSRRYVETENGWRCAPSATKCPGNQQPDTPAPVPAVAPAPEREPVAAAVEFDDAGRSDLPAGITAKCQDCSRSWQLTGRPLDHAVQMHELKHSHIVDIADGATA